MTKKEILYQLALELADLKDLQWEVKEDLDKAIMSKDEDEIKRYKRWRSNTYNRIQQTKRIAEALGIDEMKLENAAFDIQVEEATKQLQKA